MDDRWDHDRIHALLERERSLHSTFVLPMATLIETGNHIAQASGQRFECANRLARCIRDAADALSPWAAFTDQSTLWQPDNLNNLASAWPQLAVGGLSIGDATIKDVAEYYAKGGYHVEILTGDDGLKAYQPVVPVAIPRRRR